MHRIVYPGTFDPITNGHLDLVRRAAGIFDEVVVAVTTNLSKQPLFSDVERTELAKAVLADLPNVSVVNFSGLLVDFCVEHKISLILRGLRAISDFEYELQLANTNRALRGDIETLFLTSDVSYAYISSSLVREIASLGGQVEHLVPEIVAKSLRKKFSVGS